MRTLSVYFKGYVKEAFLGPFFKLLEACFELLVPLLIASMIDQIIPKKDHHDLVLLVFYLFLLAILGGLMAVIAQYVSAKAAVNYTRALTDDLFTKVLKLSQTEKDRLGESSLLTRLTSDTYQIQTGINLFLRLFLRAPIIVIGSIMMAVFISPRVTAWFLGMVLILVTLVVVISRSTAPLYQSVRKSLDGLVALVRQQLTGMRVIRSFGQSEREQEQFHKDNTLYFQKQVALGLWSASLSPLTYLVVNLSLVGLLWQGSHLVDQQLLSQGMLLALVNYLLQILAELLKAASLITNLNQSYIAAKRVREVLEAKEEDLYASLDVQSLPDKIAIGAQSLCFTYPNASATALENVDFTLESGEFLGIIGGTGSGKSTLIQLLSGLRQPTQGNLSLSVNGNTATHLGLWRSWVALVPQKAQLFQGTIRENLLLGLEDALYRDEELWQALELAQAADFVRERPDGLDTIVSAFGQNFSGGQRQRLTIARALLRRAPFLILDDATSALDYLTEARILKGLKEFEGLQNLIIVSQRTRSLKDADNILVLDKGRQLAFGKHDDLLKESAVYRDIHLSQHSTEEVQHG